MTDQQTFEEVKSVIKESFPKAKGEITPETRFPDLFGWDSVSHVTMMLDMEDRFGVTIEETKVFEIADVATLLKVIAEKKAAG
jgi:acyl carrier protein